MPVSQLANHLKNCSAKPMLGANGAGRPPMKAPKIRNSNQNSQSGKINLRSGLLPSHLGSSTVGRAWALSALHPCNEDGLGSVGIPDTTNFQVCTPEARSQLVINQPSGVAANATWDCVVLIPDIVEFSSVVFTKPSNKTWAEIRADLNSATPTATPPTLSKFSLFSSNYISEDADRWRTTHRGATAHLNASAIANQGMVYADNWGYELINHQDPADPNRGTVCFSTPLIDPTSMTERSPKMYVNNARFGCYDIMYPMSAVGAMPYFTGELLPGNADHVTFIYPDETSPNLAVLEDHAHSYVQGANHYSGVGGFTCGFMVFEGLAGDASIQLKVKQGLEMVPTNATIAQAFTKNSPMLDRDALDVVCRVAQSSAGAYPASYNDFSSILGSITNAIKGIAGPVSGIADFISKANIPVISGIADVVKSVTGTINGML